MNLQTASQMSAPFTGFDSHLQVVLLILVGCGILGGIGNYFLRDPDTVQDAKGWLRYPVLGVVAALTAPLVLSMLSSNLVEAGRTRGADYLVLAGFVILYVILTRRVFDSATLRLLGRTERLQKDLARVRAGIETIQTQPVKPPNGTGHPAHPAKGAGAHEPALLVDADHGHAKEALTHADVELLRAVAKEDIVYGNLADLVERSGVSRELALQRVAILKSWGALDTRMNDKQILQWIVTPKGKQMLADLLR
jgi:hypothetical protein